MTCPAGGAHHWDIEAPDGERWCPTSLGVCKLCDAQREFQNFVEDWFGAQPYGKGKFRPIMLRPSERGLPNSLSIHAAEMRARGMHEE